MTRFETKERQIAYQAVANDLRQALAKGEFSNGQPLPTEIELSEQYGISRQTVRRAMQDLVAEGLIFRVRGRGTFATPATSGGQQYLRSIGSVDDLRAMSEDTDLETMSPLRRKADIGAASRLHLPVDQVFTGVFRRLHQDVPFCVSEIFLPPDIGDRIVAGGQVPDKGKCARVTITSLIDEASAHPVGDAHQSITACRPPRELAGHIDMDPDDPAIRIDRLYWDVSGAPVELAISYFNPDRYTYRLNLRKPAYEGVGTIP